MNPIRPDGADPPAGSATQNPFAPATRIAAKTASTQAAKARTTTGQFLGPIWFSWIGLLMAVGLSISAYMSYVGLTGSKIAGCGGGVFSCDHVVTSRFSTVLSIPVGVPATILYVAGLMLVIAAAATHPPASSRMIRAVGWIGGLATSAGIWFVGLQIFYLEHLCSYCLAAHATGLTLLLSYLFRVRPGFAVVVRQIGGSLLAVALLATTQLLTPPPPTFEIQTDPVVVDIPLPAGMDFSRPPAADTPKGLETDPAMDEAGRLPSGEAGVFDAPSTEMENGLFEAPAAVNDEAANAFEAPTFEAPSVEAATFEAPSSDPTTIESSTVKSSTAKVTEASSDEPTATTSSDKAGSKPDMSIRVEVSKSALPVSRSAQSILADALPFLANTFLPPKTLAPSPKNNPPPGPTAVESKLTGPGAIRRTETLPPPVRQPSRAPANGEETSTDRPRRPSAGSSPELFPAPARQEGPTLFPAPTPPGVLPAPPEVLPPPVTGHSTLLNWMQWIHPMTLLAADAPGASTAASRPTDPAEQDKPSPESTDKTDAKNETDKDERKPTTVSQKPRMVMVSNGRRQLKMGDWPMLGSTRDKHVLVKMFDYTCQHCRKTHQAIRQARKDTPGGLAVVTLPIPLYRGCNPGSKTTDPKFAYRCDIAKLAVAVWLSDANKFESFHEWMMQQERSLADAKRHAASLVGADALQKQMARTTPTDYISRHVFLYREAGAGTLPKLVFTNQNVLVGELTDGRFLSKKVAEATAKP